MQKPLIVGTGLPIGKRYPYIEEGELFTSPQVWEEPNCAFRPAGDFEISSYSRMLPDPWRTPSMLVTLYAQGDHLPRGLHAINCPKILIVSDLHHGTAPLTSALKAALAEPYDLVIVQYTPQHVHFFEEAGCKRVAYIPCFGINPIRLEPKEPTRGVVFVGGMSQLHARRIRILKELEEKGVQIEVFTGVTPEQAAAIYNEAAVSLNISLNNDFNLRNFEVMAAGGCLLTDCHDDITPDNIEMYKAKRASLVNADYDYFWETHAPEKQIAKLHEALSAEARPVVIPPDEFWLKVAAYEAMQEMRCRDVGFDFIRDLQ